MRRNPLARRVGKAVCLNLLPAGLILGVAAPAAGQEQAAPPNSAGAPPPEDHAENSGQDPTRPVTRFDLRVKYTELPSTANQQTLTARADKPFQLGGGWKLSTRMDVPIAVAAIPSIANPNGTNQEIGLSDILLQGLFIAPPSGKFTYALGAQLILPTGRSPQFTTGKWQLVPTAVAVYQLPEVSRGSFVALLVRDAFSFAGKDDRDNINVVSIQPLANFQLPQQWFVSFAPEAKLDTRNGWDLFLPFDMTVGKKINPTTVMSLQGDVGIIKDYRPYDWQVEFRIGVFF